MSTCEFIERCGYFNRSAEALPQVITEGYKNRFCRADKGKCARFLVGSMLGRDEIPDDLGPHEESRAVKILAHGGIVVPDAFGAAG